ncbi:MAG: NAD(P)-dependent alcohol dehydrogenase, partial [Pseudomonadota bacterium]
MRAALVTRFGLQHPVPVVDRDAAEPGPRQCLVRVDASSVNPIDWKTRSGHYRPFLWPRLPYIPGYDLSGQVVECGPEVTGFKAWDWVMAMSDRRAGQCCAERIVVGIDALALKPATLSVDEAAALPLAGLTALQGLRDLGKLQPGHRVLVVGASGGVGHLAVQVARILGGKVTAVCSTRNVEWVRALGASQVVDYTRNELRPNGAPYDLIFDTVIKRPASALVPLLATQGILVAAAPSASLIGAAVRLRVGTAQRVRF